MEWPHKRTMQTLENISIAKEITFLDDKEIYAVTPYEVWLIEVEELDTLTDLGWVLLETRTDDTDHLEITEKGRYWLGRWKKR